MKELDIIMNQINNGLDSQKALHELSNYFLGKDYHVADSVESTKSNAIIVRDIINAVNMEIERIRHAGLVGLCFCTIIGGIIGIIIGLCIGGLL